MAGVAKPAIPEIVPARPHCGQYVPELSASRPDPTDPELHPNESPGPTDDP